MTKSTPEPISELLQHSWCIFLLRPVLHPDRSTLPISLRVLFMAAMQLQTAFEKQSSACRVLVAFSEFLTTLIHLPTDYDVNYIYFSNPVNAGKSAGGPRTGWKSAVNAVVSPEACRGASPQTFRIDQDRPRISSFISDPTKGIRLRHATDGRQTELSGKGKKDGERKRRQLIGGKVKESF